MSRSRPLAAFGAVLCLALATATFAPSALAADSQRTLIRLDVRSEADLAFLNQHQGMLDILHVKPGHHAEIAADARALRFLAERGRTYEVVAENLESSLAYDLPPVFDKAGKRVADFGVYHTWSENIAWVDSLYTQYPQVISQKWSLGLSLEGRDIWCFRVSANPEVDESEPEILIDGMHHSREIMASEFPVMFAEYLASNYGTDPEITWLLDHRELYIIPVVNPDGFVYNEVTNPNGGGMWRKNRRSNGGGTYGVDLNRNYPFQWAYDDVGSSPDPASDVYRGPTAASEPETQVIMDFINSREIRTHDTVHTYSNLTLLPWGYIDQPTPDGTVYNHMAAEMTRFNGYAPGRPAETLNYDVNGGSFDWAYGDDSKHTRFYTFSNEIGGSADGFWPNQDRRGPLFQENIWPHLYLMRVAGTWVAAHTPVVLNANKSIQPGQSGDLSFTLENQSVYDSILGLDLTVKTDDPWLQLGAATRTIGGLASLASTDLTADPLPFTVDAGCPNGHQATLTVVLHLADGDLSFPLTFTIGTPSTLISDNMETGVGNWTLDGNWGLTSVVSHSPSQSLTDSPGGEYVDLSATSATLTVPRRATGLQFWHRYDIESGWDYGRVQVGSGGVWNTVASYTGQQPLWDYVELGLADYAGQEIQVRFVMETDQSVTEDGWYLDDVTLIGDPGGNEPAPPTAVTPVGGASVAGNGLLVVDNSVDPVGGNLSYGFRVYSDAECTQLAASADDVGEGTGQTAWALPNLPDGAYYWRAWAGKPGVRSDLSPAETFTVNTGAGVDDVAIGLPGLQVLDGITGSGTRLRLNLAAGQDVQVDIYDTRGARIRQLHRGVTAGGPQVLFWDGRDGGGRAAASGVYFVRVAAGREAHTGRVVIVR